MTDKSDWKKNTAFSHFVDDWEYYVYSIGGLGIGIAGIFGVNIQPATLTKYTLMVLALLLITLGVALKKFKTTARSQAKLLSALLEEQAMNHSLTSAVSDLAAAFGRIEHRDASDVLKDISSNEEIARILRAGRSFTLVGETLFNVMNTWEMLIIDAIQRGCTFDFLFNSPDQFPPSSTERSRATHTIQSLQKLIIKVKAADRSWGRVRVMHPPSRLLCSAFAVDYLIPNGFIRVQPFLLFPEGNPTKKGHFDLYSNCARSGWYLHYQQQIQLLISASTVVMSSVENGP